MPSDATPRAAHLERVQKRYPRPARLAGGRDLTLRLMGDADRDAYLAFARSLPQDDLLYLRWDMTDARVVDHWLEDIRLQRMLTVLAWDGDNIVAEASLTHSETDWTRHLGDVRMVVSPSARGEGLGRYLAEELFVAAEIIGLARLTAQMTNDQEIARAVFEGLGFEPIAVLPGHVITRSGEQRDLLIMAHDLLPRATPGSTAEA